MTNPQLVDYVRQRLAAGASREEIIAVLKPQGWDDHDIAETFDAIDVKAPKAAAPAVVQPAAVKPAAPAVSPMAATQPATAAATPAVAPAQVQQATPTAAPMLNQTAAAPMSGGMPVAGATPAQATPIARTMPVAQMQQQGAPSSKRWMALGVVVLLILCGALGGVAYAFVEHLGPFSVPVIYTQENFFTGLVGKISTINSSSYSLSGAVAVVPREAGAVPFTIQNSNQAQLEQQYKNDAKRADDVSQLLYALTSTSGAYPATLAQAKSPMAKYSPRASSTLATTDPATKTAYTYSTTNGGKDFALKVTFETPNAIAALKKSYNYSATTTLVVGQTATFTKASPRYFYFASRPPKPFLVQLADMMQQIPPGTTASMSVGATSNWSEKDANWKFNVDATADLGDFSFKLNADALKKGSVYYVRINNIPGVFGAMFTSLKGQWVSIDPAASSTWPKGYTSYLSFAKGITQTEGEYKKQRQESTDLMRQLVGLADQEHLLSFVGTPHTEQVSGRLLYRYDLQVNKESILPFYKKMGELAAAHPTLANAGIFNDPGTISYLQSPEFAQMFDYYQKNTHLVLWVDSQGYPASVEYTLRVVPPDTALALKDKQMNVTFKLQLSNINAPVTIDAPSGAKPIGDIIKSEVDAQQKKSLQMR